MISKSALGRENITSNGMSVMMKLLTRSFASCQVNSRTSKAYVDGAETMHRGFNSFADEEAAFLLPFLVRYLQVFSRFEIEAEKLIAVILLVFESCERRIDTCVTDLGFLANIVFTFESSVFELLCKTQMTITWPVAGVANLLYFMVAFTSKELMPVGDSLGKDLKVIGPFATYFLQVRDSTHIADRGTRIFNCCFKNEREPACIAKNEIKEHAGIFLPFIVYMVYHPVPESRKSAFKLLQHLLSCFEPNTKFSLLQSIYCQIAFAQVKSLIVDTMKNDVFLSWCACPVGLQTYLKKNTEFIKQQLNLISEDEDMFKVNFEVIGSLMLLSILMVKKCLSTNSKFDFMVEFQNNLQTVIPKCERLAMEYEQQILSSVVPTIVPEPIVPSGDQDQPFFSIERPPNLQLQLCQIQIFLDSLQQLKETFLNK